MGKAYANKKSKENRPEGDFYPTPISLLWVMNEVITAEFARHVPVLEPCSGNEALAGELRGMGYAVRCNDLYRGGVDYLGADFQEKAVITNPPFSQWDDFVFKAKTHTDKCMFIGRLNYFGTASRLASGIWNELKAVYCFNRYVDYRTPPRADGNFCVGAMATGWFLWEREWQGSPTIHFLDVQKYATLGGFN
jgi:hypothetical protein